MAQDRQPDVFRRGNRTARGIDTDDQSFQIIVERFVEEFGNAFAACRARSCVTIDDFAGNGHDTDGVPVFAEGLVGKPWFQLGMGVGARAGVPVVFTDDFRHPFAKLNPVAQLVDEASLKRGLRQIALVILHPLCGCLCNQVEVDLRAGLFHIGLPFFPQRSVKGGIVLACFGRHAVARKRFDCRFIGADLVDACVDFQFFQQIAVIQARSARSGDDRTAQRVDPDFAGMGGKHDCIVAIRQGIGQHGFLCRADAVESRANRLHVNLSAAAKFAQIEHDRLDPFVGRGLFQRVNQIAGLIFADRFLPRKEQLQRVDFGLFFNHISVEIEQKRTVPDLCRAGPRGQDSVKKREEQQQKDQA